MSFKSKACHVMEEGHTIETSYFGFPINCLQSFVQVNTVLILIDFILNLIYPDCWLQYQHNFFHKVLNMLCIVQPKSEIIVACKLILSLRSNPSKLYRFVLFIEL